MSFIDLERKNTDLGVGVALDFTSASSGSSITGPPDIKQRESSEKVNAWLRGDTRKLTNPLDNLDQPELPHGDIKNERSSLERKLTYEDEIAPVKNKFQCLLSFGEYSLFKKWKVLAEGDFIPFSPCSGPAPETYYHQKLVKKRAKIALRDIRTLAITKNWLIMARLTRLYQVERDAVVPSGISLEIRRLVPLRYLRVCVARPAARVIGIANQSGMMKQYQMLDKPTPAEDDPFLTWRKVIGQLRPTLNDDTLFLTLNTFERWQRQHACREEMNSLKVRPPVKSARFSPRRRRSADVTSKMTKPYMRSDWDSVGVTNMCFKNDESDDVERVSKTSPHAYRDRLWSDISRDSGYSDGMSPMTPPYVTSPNSDGTMGLYHRAWSRRKSLEIENKSTLAPPTGLILSDELSRQREEKCAYFGNEADQNSARRTSLDDVFSTMTPEDSDAMRERVLKKRSVSLLGTETEQIEVTKQRSLSQPALLDISTPYLVAKLYDISEEEVSIDHTGVSRLIKRRDLNGNSMGFGSSISGEYDMTSPLLEDSQFKLTIYPGYQNKSGISLNDWQVKLGEKEPEKCRCDSKPAARPLPPPPSESYESVQYVTGNVVSIGDSEPMTSSEAPVEVEGIVAEIGTSREMSISSNVEHQSEPSTTYSTSTGVSVEVPPPSTGRRKKTLKSIFRLGFLTTKMRKKSRGEDSTSPSPDAGPVAPSPGNRHNQRRMSRLEMNEPIEDIFSEVKFETIQKRPSSANSGEKVADDDTDDDIIEDPEAIMRSIINDEAIREKEHGSLLKENFHPAVVHDSVDVINEHNDVIESGNLEEELLLPDVGTKNGAGAPPCVENSTKTSELDLR